MRKPKASGKNIPEAQRGSVQVKLRLQPETAWELDVLAAHWKMTRSDVVAQLVEAEINRRATQHKGISESDKGVDSR